MDIRGILLVIGLVLKVAEALLGHHCWVFAVEAFVRLAAVALVSVVGA